MQTFCIDIALRKYEEYDIFNLIHSHRVLFMSQRLYRSDIISEKGMGCESPAVNCRCVHRMFLYPLSKDSHWETEKAGYENADRFVYMV